MSPSNPHPDALAQASVADPLLQYLVVRRERLAPVDALISGAARAVVRADRAFRDLPAYGELTAVWRSSSYRKVCLRASERDWAKLLECYPVAFDDDADPLIAALPVMHRSARERILRDLQVYDADVSALPHRVPPRPGEPLMIVAHNPHAAMSGGKLLAQIGHAALMAVDAADDLRGGRLEGGAAGSAARWELAIAEWEAAGAAVLPAFIDVVTFADLAAREDAVVVTDAGLTEVAPGTRTALALRPSSGEELGEILRRIGRSRS